MKRQIIALTGCFFAGAIALASPAAAQQKTATACAEEWRANKAENQAKKITEKAYVAQCRAGAESSAPSAPRATVPRPTTTTEKTAKACAEEWRANKSENQAKKITEKEYVAQCRTGAVASRPAVVPPTEAPPTTTAPAESTKTTPPSRNTVVPTGTSTGSPTARSSGTAAAPPTGAGQYSSEAQAKIMCLTDTVVWVNLSSKIYHFSGHKDYGHTKSGAYMCQKNADAAGTRAAKNEKR